MDIKKLNNVNLNLELKITEEQKKKAVAVLFKNARLIFLVFLGVVTIYSFDVVFKKAYVDINYIQYPVYTNALGDNSIQPKLEKILGIIEARKNNLSALEAKEYPDPFSYRDDKVAKQVPADAEEGEETTGESDPAAAGIPAGAENAE